MRIAFICGSLQPGQDGVGDYTIRLAAELNRMGHTAVAVAVHDVHLTDKVSGTINAEGTLLQVLRIPAVWSSRKRFNHAEEWLHSFNPDWVSLQYVMYAFASNGLPFLLGYNLRKIAQGKKLHIMFHELWIGIDKENFIKAYTITTLQKFIIKRTLSLLNPDLVHTHLPVYKSMLEDLGQQVDSLPLFSNIEVVPKRANTIEDKVLRIGFFSQAELGQSIVLFLSQLRQQALVHNLDVEVWLIGGTEGRMNAFKKQMQVLPEYKHKVSYTGFLSAEELSGALQGCTLGLTPVPRHGLGKSGSVAAFMAHGVPVAAPNVHSDFSSSEIGFFSDELRSAVLLCPDYSSLQKAKAKVGQAKKEIELTTVANKFLSDLKEAKYAKV